jgi:hypothetical protein
MGGRIYAVERAPLGLLMANSSLPAGRYGRSAAPPTAEVPISKSAWAKISSGLAVALFSPASSS